MSRKGQHLAAGAGVLAALAAVWLWLYSGPPVGLRLGTPGTHDFVQYWAAARLLGAGRNPYRGSEMQDFQAAMGRTPGAAEALWTPPWTLLLLAPFLALDFPQAALAWLAFNGLLLAALAAFGPAALGVRLSPVVALVACAACEPAVETLIYGQVGLWLAAWVVLFFAAARAGRHVAAGLCLVPLLVKPHLFLLCAVPGLVWLGRRRERWVAVAAFAAGALGVVVASQIVWPHSLEYWWSGLGHDQGARAGVAAESLRQPTLAVWVRLALLELTGRNSTWPAGAVVVAGLGAVALGYARREIDWPRDGPLVLCWSLLAAPYCWVPDQCLGLPAVLLIWARGLAPAAPTRARVAAGVAAAVQLGFFAAAQAKLCEVDAFVVVPPVLAGCLWAGGRPDGHTAAGAVP